MARKSNLPREIVDRMVSAYVSHDSCEDAVISLGMPSKYAERHNVDYDTALAKCKAKLNAIVQKERDNGRDIPYKRLVGPSADWADIIG